MGYLTINEEIDEEQLFDDIQNRTEGEINAKSSVVRFIHLSHKGLTEKAEVTEGQCKMKDLATTNL